MGDVFRDAKRALLQCGPVLLLLSLALILTSSIGAAWLRLHPLLAGAGFSISLTNGFVTWQIQAAPLSLFIASATWAVAEVLEGRSPVLGEALSNGMRFFFPVLIVQGLYLLGTMAGAMLLIVPGVIVVLMWLLASQAMVVDRLDVRGAFKRSQALTKGHRWALLGLIIAYSLVVLAIEWVIFQITAPGMSFIQAFVTPINAYGVGPLLTVVTTLLSNTVLTAIYLRLRSRHRGSADLTAEVFA